MEIDAATILQEATIIDPSCLLHDAFRLKQTIHFAVQNMHAVGLNHLLDLDLE